jgi:uncharacterized protein (TIGR02646 family)
MHYIKRLPLDDDESKNLDSHKNWQSQPEYRDTSAQKYWENHSDNATIRRVREVLKIMAGLGARCMYCVHSHGSDIEHFYPKAVYPDKMFEWGNLLLCCTECGREKGTKFPVAYEQPLLINPTKTNPWADLDFDPVTSELTARYDASINAPSPRGKATIEVLKFDRREDLAKEYGRTWKRLVRKIGEFLLAPQENDVFISRLLEKDDHKLLGWCFHGTGHTEQPFAELQRQHPEVWAQIKARLPVPESPTP